MFPPVSGGKKTIEENRGSASQAMARQARRGPRRGPVRGGAPPALAALGAALLVLALLNQNPVGICCAQGAPGPPPPPSGACVRLGAEVVGAGGMGGEALECMTEFAHRAAGARAFSRGAAATAA